MGSVCSDWPDGGCRNRAFSILTPVLALTPSIQDKSRMQGSARTDLCGVVSRTCSQEHDAVSKMKGGPSESADRSRFQTTVSCWGGKAAGGDRCGKGAAFDRVMCR